MGRPKIDRTPEEKEKQQNEYNERRRKGKLNFWHFRVFIYAKTIVNLTIIGTKFLGGFKDIEGDLEKKEKSEGEIVRRISRKRKNTEDEPSTSAKQPTRKSYFLTW